MTAQAVPTDTVRSAYDLVLSYAVGFERMMVDENTLEITLDKDALWNLATSYVDDVTRYSSYHETELPDRARRAAYLCKWLMKFRPIVVVDPEANPDDEIRTTAVMANELFALWCVSGLMEVDLDLVITDKVREILLYSLRHRYNSEDAYILFFAQLCELC